MHTQRKTSITANRYHDGSKTPKPKRDKKNGYRTNGIDWHPYPQEKPKADGYYNVTLDIKCTATAHYNPKNDEWRGDVFWVRNGCIIAWAELLKPMRDKKNGYRTKTRSQITEVHRARSENGLGCKNCIYANFCAAQPNLREYLYGIAKQDMKELTSNKYWRLF